MSDQEPKGTAAGTAEELLDALRSAAGDAATRETIAELGARARAIVEGLSRVARPETGGASSSATSSSSSCPGAQGAPRRASADDRFDAGDRFYAGDREDDLGAASPGEVAGLQRGLDALRAGVAQVGDLLEATLERLETVEVQLGDPAESVEQRVTAGLQGCERVLAGIEHRLQAVEVSRRAAAAAASAVSSAVSSAASSVTAQRYSRDGSAVRAPVVLVVAPGSSRRAALCLALEREGLRTVAALDLVSAQAAAQRQRPDVALLAPEEDHERFLDDWAEAVDDAVLPPAVALGVDEHPTRPGLLPAREQHGRAALAAALFALARRSAGRSPLHRDAARSDTAESAGSGSDVSRMDAGGNDAAVDGSGGDPAASDAARRADPAAADPDADRQQQQQQQQQ